MRRERDSNPRTGDRSTVFETAPFDHSGISPFKSTRLRDNKSTSLLTNDQSLKSVSIVCVNSPCQLMVFKEQKRLKVASSPRRKRDSNPRYIAVQRFSRPPHSTALPFLRCKDTNFSFQARVLKNIFYFITKPRLSIR